MMSCNLTVTVQSETSLHRGPASHPSCDEVTRFVLISLTNLTFGNTHIK